MSTRCPEFEVLLAATEDRLEPEQAAPWQAHLEGCPECRRRLEDVRALGAALAELARTERHCAPIPDWAELTARLERPGLLERAPLGLATAFRQADALMQPAVAGGIAATLAGLVLGTWFALALPRGATTSVEAAPYEVSSLLADDAGGLAESYFSLEIDTSGEPGASLGTGVGSPTAATDPDAADSGGAVR